MAIKFGGDFLIQRNRQEVYDFLTDPKRFGPLLPEYESMTQEDATHFTVKVKVGISYIRGTAEVKLELAEADNPTHALYKGQGKVAGGSAIVSAGFNLEDVPEGTKVLWTGEAQVFGKLASMAGGLLEPVAKKNIEKLVEGLRAAMAAKTESAGTSVASPSPETLPSGEQSGGPVEQQR